MPPPIGAARRDDSGEAAKKAPVRSRGLDRAVEIFQLLHAVRKPIPIGEIARRLKAPRSTIYEIVNLFLAADILEYAGDGSEVFFGRAIYLYANDYFATHAMVRLGQEEVRRLAAQTGETCQFCMPVGNKYTVVSMQNSARLFRIGSDVGVLVPIPWTASGRFFVAHMSLAELKAFIPPEDFRLQNGKSRRPEAVPHRGQGGARRRHLRHRRPGRRLRHVRRSTGARSRGPMRRLHLLYRLERDRRGANDRAVGDADRVGEEPVGRPRNRAPGSLSPPVDAT